MAVSKVNGKAALGGRIWSQLKVFVGGPIQFAFTKHSQFDPWLRTHILQIIDLIESMGIEVFSAHRYERFGELNVVGKSCQVARRDFAWMQACDLFVVVLPDHDGRLVRTDGTHIELGWASAFYKPILLFRDPTISGSHLLEGLDTVSPVSTLPLNMIDNDPEQVVETIHNILTNLPDARLASSGLTAVDLKD
ncbi:MAG TPA: hypothetical protein ENI79_02410 [Rhodospirillales bacterium]|nr:hypothetical protein [Rhodospirillales bacterium]